MELEEGTLRSLAVSVRPVLPRLLGDSDRAGVLDRELTAALLLPPGMARETLHRALFLGAPAVRTWCDLQLVGMGRSGPQPDIDPVTDVSASRPVSEARSRSLWGSRFKDWARYGRRLVSGGLYAAARSAEVHSVLPRSANPFESRDPKTEGSERASTLAEPVWDDVDARTLAFTVPQLKKSGESALVGRSYQGQFFVGHDRSNLLSGNTLIAQDEVGVNGLDTQWTVMSRTIRLDRWSEDGRAEDPDVAVTTIESGDVTDYIAVFPLHIPGSGPSAVRRLALTPLTGPSGFLDVEVRIGPDVYRRLSATVAVHSPADPPGDSSPGNDGPTATAPFAVGEERLVSAAHAGLGPAAEWQQPARTLTLTPARDLLIVTDSEDGVPRYAAWQPDLAGLNSAIKGARTALDRLRDAFPHAFGPADAGDLAQQLRDYVVDSDWYGRSVSDPQDEFFASAPEFASSPELRSLATQGRLLFQALFTDEDLQNRLAALDPGDLINFAWPQEASAAVPVVPLPLLFLGDIPRRGEPVDPTGFLGLRHRLAYRVREPLDTTRALGDWRATVRGHFLYWGSAEADEVAEHAARHAADLSLWQPITVLPTDVTHPSTTELADFLDRDSGGPVSVLYFYCHCVTPDGTDPVLRFGSTNNAEDVLRIDDLMAGPGPIPGAPVAFVNACKSGFAEPMLSNQLMDAFFTRGCRSYVGTEVRVPAALAANFAIIFFSFLYGAAGRTMAPVGEAMSQARRFLWRQQANPGGLFYNSVNDYKLYALSDPDVQALRIR